MTGELVCVCVCVGGLCVLCASVFGGVWAAQEGKIIAGSFADELLLTTMTMYVFVWWGGEVKLFKHISKLTHQFQIS